MDRTDDIEQVVAESPEEVAMMLKGAAHPARVVILASLAADHGEFSSLVRRTGLSKNALVNHLNHLIDLGLVRRALRGEYVLTDDGRSLIRAAANTYRCSVRRREMAEEAVRRSYMQPDEALSMSVRTISKPAKFRPSWISYYGAMSGLLSSQGTEHDLAEVAGRSGYAFIINTAKGRLCPSGPTALGLEAWVQIREGTETLGYRLEHWSDYSAGLSGGKPSVKELEKMRRLFDRVRNEVDKGQPSVLWGLGLPEYGLVNGYEGDCYIASTCRTVGEQDAAIKYHQLDAPGCYDAYFIKGPNTKKEKTKETLTRAVRFAQGEVGAERGYVNGPQAYLDWAEALEASTLDVGSYLGNAYVGMCTRETRQLAAQFLKKLAGSEDCRELETASLHYAELGDHLSRFTALFPFAMSGELGANDRKAGAALLRRAYELESTAVGSLGDAMRALG